MRIRPLYVGKYQGRDWKFQSGLKFSIPTLILSSLDWNVQAHGLKISRDQSGLSFFNRRALWERGVPQAYVHAHASSATLCSAHVLRSFSVFSISERESDAYQNRLGYISDMYPNPSPPCHCTPPMIILNFCPEGIFQGGAGGVHILKPPTAGILYAPIFVPLGPKLLHYITLLFRTLRAKGTLISEPRSSTPCEMRFFPREKGKTAFSKKNPRQRPFSLSRVGKIASRRG